MLPTRAHRRRYGTSYLLVSGANTPIFSAWLLDDWGLPPRYFCRVRTTPADTVLWEQQLNTRHLPSPGRVVIAKEQRMNGSFYYRHHPLTKSGIASIQRVLPSQSMNLESPTPRPLDNMYPGLGSPQRNMLQLYRLVNAARPVSFVKMAKRLNKAHSSHVVAALNSHTWTV